MDRPTYDMPYHQHRDSDEDDSAERHDEGAVDTSERRDTEDAVDADYAGEPFGTAEDRAEDRVDDTAEDRAEDSVDDTDADRAFDTVPGDTVPGDTVPGDTAEGAAAYDTAYDADTDTDTDTAAERDAFREREDVLVAQAPDAYGVTESRETFETHEETPVAEVFAAAEAPTVAAVAQGAPGQDVLEEPELPDFGQRWHEIKASFVDDPRQAVEQADALVEEAVNALTTHRKALSDRWQNAEADDTERLRLTLREYHALFGRLNSGK